MTNRRVDKIVCVSEAVKKAVIEKVDIVNRTIMGGVKTNGLTI